MRFPGILLLFSAVSANCPAQELTMYLMEVPPLTINAVERKGVVGDIVLEALRRAGYQAKLLVVPSNRALAAVANPASRNTLIIPLARVEAREQKYTWIAPILKVNRAFFSLDKAVTSFDEARAAFKLIGVARGTAGVHILRENGFAEGQVYELNQDQRPQKMLLNRRIDAWYGPLAEGKAWVKAGDIDNRVQSSVPLGPTYNYLACSKICDEAIVARLTTALKAMEKDGTSKAMQKKYGEIE